MPGSQDNVEFTIFTDLVVRGWRTDMTNYDALLKVLLFGAMI